MENDNKNIEKFLQKVISTNIHSKYNYLGIRYCISALSKKDILKFGMDEAELKQIIKKCKIAGLRKTLEREMLEAEDDVALGQAARGVIVQMAAEKRHIERCEKERKAELEKEREHRAQEAQRKKAEKQNKAKAEGMTQAKILKAAKLISSFTPEQKKLFVGLNIQ